jgi:hypothetical protein
MQWGNRGLATYDQFGGELSMDELVFDGGPHGVATFQIDAADVFLGAAGIRMSASRPGGEVEIRLLSGSMLDALEAGSNLFAEVAGRLRVQLEEGSMIHVAGNVSDIRQLSDEVEFFPKGISACDSHVRGFVFDYDPASDSTSITSGPVVDRLFPGDADRDFDFDQLDLVRVQIAAKYLTGKAATWGEGDWDGGPGGTPDNPPPGDGLFNQLDIIAALEAGIYASCPLNALEPSASTLAEPVSIVYRAATGDVELNAAGRSLSSIHLASASGIFTGAAPQNLGGAFDVDSDAGIFKATFGSSFGSLTFGTIAEPGLSEKFLLGDLTASGSLLGGGSLGAVELIYVPEPSPAVLLGLAALVVAFFPLGAWRQASLLVFQRRKNE